MNARRARISSPAWPMLRQSSIMFDFLLHLAQRLTNRATGP